MPRRRGPEKMVPYCVYLTIGQHTALKELSRLTNVPVGEYVRAGIEARLAAGEREQSFRQVGN
jgi:hypothetical protein